MNKPNFLAGSVLFHLVITFLLLILPPPYPKPQYGDSGDGTPVVLTKATSRDVPDLGGGDGPELPGGDSVTPAGMSAPVPGDTAEPARRMRETSSRTPEPLHVDEDVSPVDATDSTMPEHVQPVSGLPPAAQPPAAQQAELVAPVASPPSTPITAGSNEHPITSPDGVTTDRTAIDFKYQRGWPVPGMVRVRVRIKGLGRWHAERSEDWIIISNGKGESSGEFSVGVDTSRLALGFYEGTVSVLPKLRGGSGSGDCEIPVSLIVLPEDKARPELPHTSWDGYLSGDCKVCHLPKELLPSGDFMVQPEFCGLCHNKAGMAEAMLVDGTGHPMLVEAGSGGTKTPTYGTVATGPRSNRMAGHLKDGKLVVCVTCHNVMEKPGDYGRAWEMTTTDDRRTYRLYMGGWSGMGHVEPSVYVTDGLTPRPKMLKSARGYLADPSGYTYDETEGTVRFRTALKPGANVYVTLGTPYLRVTTEDNRLCYDCHSENTHQGLNCLDCHVVHGTDNIMAVRRTVRTPDRASRRVVFRARGGKNSFADGDAVYDGICEVCHTMTKRHRRGAGSTVHKDGKDYSGTDCTRCHRHSDGFSM
ncbi:MAG: hypothetical protein HZA22_03280 [Nitrospirae bacterium]|nr:hypothetical protein [Nitrospirota bacterium]MBI5695771.1 hypothetical protein [Nitrospirota bacterium]